MSLQSLFGAAPLPLLIGLAVMIRYFPLWPGMDQPPPDPGSSLDKDA